MTEWVNNAARDAARKQNATAYAAWLSITNGVDMEDLDDQTHNVSLAGAEW